MKKRENIAKVIDSIVTLIQALMSWIITTFEYSSIIKFLIYLLVVVLFVIYHIFFREKLINAFVLSQSVDVKQLKKSNYLYAFHNVVLPIIKDINYNIGEDEEFDLLYSFSLWEKAIDTMIEFFWSNDGICNVEMSKTVFLSKNKVYKNEVIIVTKKLLIIYYKNDFSRIVNSYNCKMLQKEINRKLCIINKMSKL